MTIQAALPVKPFHNLRTISRRGKFRKTSLHAGIPPRRCSFCNTGHLSDGAIAFVGVTACATCLRDEATADFRELLDLQQDVYRQKFAGGIN